MHKEPIRAHFIAASKTCLTKFISKKFLKLLNLSSIKYKVSIINHISTFYINHFVLQKMSSPFLKILKRFIEKLMQKLFRYLALSHFILNFLILICLVWWTISLAWHLREVIKNAMIFLEIQLFTALQIFCVTT